MSSDDSDDEGGFVGGTFAALQGIEDDSEWQEARESKKKAAKAAKKTIPAAVPVATPAAIAHVPTATLRNRVATSARPLPAPPPAVNNPSPPKPRTHDENGKVLAEDYYRAFQRCYVSGNQDVVLRFHKTDIVRIRPNGDVLLNCGGYYTTTTMCSMNDALRFINITVKASNVRNGNTWVVQSELGSTPYIDNQVVVPGRTVAHQQRGQLVLAGMQELLGRWHGDPNASSTSGSKPSGHLNTNASHIYNGGATQPNQQQFLQQQQQFQPQQNHQQQQQQQQFQQPQFQQYQPQPAYPARAPQGPVSPSVSTPPARAQPLGYQLPSASTIPGAVFADANAVPWIPGATAMSYAERLRAKQQAQVQTQAQQQGQPPNTQSGVQQGPSSAVQAYGGYPATAAPVTGPVQFAARSANLTAEAFSRFLAPDSAAGAVQVEEEDEMLCTVCFEAGREAVLIPCSHCVLCAKCADLLVERHGTCPLCRQEVDTVLHIEG